MEHRLISHLAYLLDSMQRSVHDHTLITSEAARPQGTSHRCGRITFLFALTSRIDAVPSLLLQSRRFDHVLEMPAMDAQARFQLLQARSQSLRIGSDASVTCGDHGLNLPSHHRASTLQAAAYRTNGFTGADLESVLREAALSALKRVRDDQKRVPSKLAASSSLPVHAGQMIHEPLSPSSSLPAPGHVSAWGSIDHPVITAADFDDALLRVRPSYSADMPAMDAIPRPVLDPDTVNSGGAGGAGANVNSHTISLTVRHASLPAHLRLFFNKVAGPSYEHVVHTLWQSVLRPYAQPERYARLGVAPPTGAMQFSSSSCVHGD